MYIRITQLVDFEQTNWSVRYCFNCERTDVIIAGNAVRKVYLGALIIGSEKIGRMTCCGWCGVYLKLVRGPKRIPIKGWDSDEGLDSLF